ncbi:hypothetical protein EX30DRAFT_343067 [Ascodesmis nigricans]|uniref:F-box domain-containing protein n=1 Tax=Ascodesmis nigricans TaxID=341454 RepID=A0A4S2MN95_9PEZI|nr:hypothetical protein EX30DRAFT_343067 [Ascodesmis nigricans]
MPTILQLPAELHAEILRFVATSEHPEVQVRNLISVASTCHAFHHAVFCDASDHLWRAVAIGLGLHPSVTLDQVMYPGSSCLEARRWLKLVQLNLRIRAPFPQGRPTWPRVKRAESSLSWSSAAWDWRRTAELVIAGEGNQKSAKYDFCHTSHLENGLAVFSVSNFKGLPGRQATCMYYPTEDRADIVHSESATPGGWTVTPFPTRVGYGITSQAGNSIVQRIRPDGNHTPKWTVDELNIDRITSNGNLLVAASFPGEDSENPKHMASRLTCIEHSAGTSRILWDFDVSEAWEDEDAYYRYPHVKNFHMTSTHVVCLITRHPNSQLGKLTRTEFVVLGVRTGSIVRVIKVNPKITGAIESATNLRAAFTTAFKHDFLLTDFYIVSGGPGSGLFVWNYTSPDAGLLYTLPDPWELSAQNDFPRQYSNISMSTDGRYIAATTSDQMLIFDLVEKILSGAYSNGRKVEQKDRYISNPPDDFPGGVWCWVRDWECGTDEKTGGVYWRERKSSEDSGGIVAYLTTLPDEQAVARSTGSRLLHMRQRLYGSMGIGPCAGVFGGLTVLVVAVALQQMWNWGWTS